MQKGVLPDEGLSIEAGEEAAGRALPQVSGRWHRQLWATCPLGDRSSLGRLPVEGHWQQADVLVGDQAEEDASQASICNPRGSVSSGDLMCLGARRETAQPHWGSITFFCCLNELTLHLF